MDLRHLETFCTVVRRGSFLGAAKDLDCAQSTVTLHIQQLEADLAVELFARNGKRVRLTEAGRTVAGHADQVLERVAALRETAAELTAGQAGNLRIGAIEPTASLRLPPPLVRYCRERPRVRLSVDVGGTESICRQVAAGDLDLGICSPPPARLGLRFEPLFVEAMALLVPEEHPLAAKPEIRIGDVAAHRLLLTERICAYRMLTEWELSSRGITPATEIEISSMGAIRRAVQSGLGIAILPAVIVTPAPSGTVVRQIADADLGLPVGLIRLADAGPPGRALAALLAACRSHLPRALDHA